MEDFSSNAGYAEAAWMKHFYILIFDFSFSDQLNLAKCNYSELYSAKYQLSYDSRAAFQQPLVLIDKKKLTAGLHFSLT